MKHKAELLELITAWREEVKILETVIGLPHKTRSDEGIRSEMASLRVCSDQLEKIVEDEPKSN